MLNCDRSWILLLQCEFGKHPAPRLISFQYTPPLLDAAIAPFFFFTWAVDATLFGKHTSMICSSPEKAEATLDSLKTLACPNCKKIGFLNRHGYLRGYDCLQDNKRSIRANRVFCNNRSAAKGCGRTFSIWLAGTLKRLSLPAQNLWQFLSSAAHCPNKATAFDAIDSSLSHSTAYRIWDRFQKAQSIIRTALMRLCPPPHLDELLATQRTIAHLKAAFQLAPPGEPFVDNPIAFFQVQLQISFF